MEICALEYSVAALNNGNRLPLEKGLLMTSAILFVIWIFYV